MTARPYLLAAAALLALLALAALWPWPASQPSAARADERVQPVIHSVSPELPYCVLVRSPHAWARTLTLTGEGFDVDADRHLQLRFVGRGDASIHFGLEVEWVSSTEIRLDMALVEQHLREEERFPAYARLTGGYSDIPWESYAPLSDWSPAFLIAVDQDACPAAQPTPTPTPEPSPTPTPTPFPLTPPTRGVAGDLWADVVLGKPGFSEITPYEVAPHKLFNPGGVVVDRSADSGRAYVWDAGNSRVLGVDLAKCYAGEGPCSAEVVLGQPSGYDHSACNGDGGFQNFPSRAPAGPNTLCGLPDWALSPLESYTFVTMAIGNAGGLFVPDSYNNRVLKYDAPFERDAIADRVWGQSGFSGNLCNLGLAAPTAETLCFHSSTNQNVVERYGSGVEFDADGNLWVADSGNNRVLRFPRDPTMDEVAQTADLALGQQDFESAGTGSGLAEFHAPSAVAIDRSGLLYVADSGNHRVLVFEPPFATGMPATGELDASFRFPTSIETAADGQGVWVNNTGGSTIELWSLAGKLGAVADPVSGRLRGGGIGVDNQGGLLAALSFEQDIVRFPTQAPGDDPGALNEGRRLFAKGQERNHIGTHGLMSAIGVAAWGDQLIVSDMRRLMFWNGLDSLTSGQPADGVVGDSFFVPEWPSCCGRIKADAAGRLWVLGSGWDYIDVYQLPLHERSAPLHTILTRNASFPVLGQSARITLGHGDRRGIKGITPVGQGEFLWLADTDNHRVLRIRDPLINPVVDVVLGQHDADGRLCNRTTDPGPHTGVGHHERGTPAADTLCFPGALSIDRLGNLYVSDHSLEIQGNRRLLVFLAESLPTDNISTIFAPSASKIFTDASDGTLSLGFQETLTGMIDLSPSRFYADDAATWETAFDSKNRMAVGYNAYAGPRFVGLYDDPLGPGLLPDAYLYDVGAMHYSAAFDDNDNLYVGDLNLARVLVYFNPFNDTSGPAPTPTPDSSLAPLPEYPVDIVSADPAPPFCVLRSSARPYETTLELGIDGLPEGDDFLLEFRKVTSAEILGPYSPSPQFIEDAGDGHSRVAIPQPPFWQRLWPHNRRVSLTARAIQSDGAPLSGWSPAFLLADDVESCGAALPTPTPTPTPTPEPTPTPMPEPTSTPTPEPTPTPIREPTPTPTREPTPTPTPEPTPTPQPALTPTPEPTPTSTLEPTPTPTLEPTPTPTLEPTPTPTLEPTPTPTLEPAPAPPTPEGDNRTLLRLGILAAGAALAAVIAALYIRRRRR